jgi:hypothetical protein
MPRHAQLVLALILLLVLAPLANATCGIRCLAVTPHHPMPAAILPHHCVGTSTCCHSSGPAICSASTASDVTAATFTTADTTAPHGAPALTIVAADPLLQNGRTITGRGIDSSPRGQPRADNPIPLRV